MASERERSDVTRGAFETDARPFDLLFAPSGAPPYEELKQRAAEVAPFHLAFRVASIEDLIAMKRAAGREKDATHLTALFEFLRK